MNDNERMQAIINKLGYDPLVINIKDVDLIDDTPITYDLTIEEIEWLFKKALKTDSCWT